MPSLHPTSVRWASEEPAHLPSAWRRHRQDGGTDFGVTVTAETGHGDTTFTFEVNTLDQSCEQAAERAAQMADLIAALETAP